MTAQRQPGFRVLVAGAGPAVFEQLGLWDPIREATVPLTDRKSFDDRGYLFEDSALLKILYEKTRRHVAFMDRRFYLEVLYANIKDRNKVRPNTGVAFYEETKDGVLVTTDRGETLKGSILVGADGVHSAVRNLMADALSKTNPPRYKQLTEGFVVNYRTVFGTSHNSSKGDVSKPLLPDGIVHNVFYRNVSGAIAAGMPGLVFWFLFIKEDAPVQVRAQKYQRYTDEDTEAMIQKYAHLAVGPGYTFGDLWDSRVKAGMVPLEGVIEGGWNSGGRVVLIGDAAAKSTINIGLGANTAVEGVVHLTNVLVSLLDRSTNPTGEELAAMFNRYEAKQLPRAKLAVSISSFTTRYEAMETWWLRLARLLSPWIPDSWKAYGFLRFMAGTPTLAFLPDTDMWK